MKQPEQVIKSEIYQLEPAALRDWLFRHIGEWQELEVILKRQLNEFLAAWPLVKALQNQGDQELIQVLAMADESALTALQVLTQDNDLSILINTFLVKNNQDLELINRNRLIQFLRQPDFNAWFSQYLDSLESQAINTLSLKLLLLGDKPYTNECERLKDLKTCITTYPFTAHLETMLCICTAYQREIQHELNSPVSKAFILLLHELLNSLELTKQIEFIKGINQEFVLLIIELCLQGCISENGVPQQVCYRLLTLLCSERCAADAAFMQQIQSRLQQPDLLLCAPDLHEMATAIIAAQSEQEDPDFIGHWIQQLLTLPNFVAQSSPLLLKQLSERFGLCVFTLNQEQFNKFIASFSQYGPSVAELQEHMNHINHQLIKHPQSRDYWLAKYYKLLAFSIDQALNFYRFQLEIQCKPGMDDTEKVLDVIYNSDYVHYPNLRFDLLLQAINQAYYKPDNKSGTILADWFRNYYPQSLDALFELGREKEVELFHSAGQRIGFLNEQNQAMTFVEDEPTLLVQRGSFEINEPVYDKNGRVLGYLTESGQLTSGQEKQKNSGAFLLAKVPEQELANSISGLDLLIHQVLFEQSIDTVYADKQSGMDNARLLWLERQFMRVVQNTSTVYSAEAIASLMNYMGDETKFIILATIKNRTNAKCVFHYLLNQDNTRSIWLSGLYEADFQRFLERHDVVDCLADYLFRYHECSWFAAGLQVFAHYGVKHKINNLLSEALLAIVNNLTQDSRSPALLDALLERLISTEECAAIVLKDFLSDRSQVAVQRIKNPEVILLAQYINKQQLIATIKTLNKAENWQGTAQYKLVLHLLDKAFASLFPSPELHLAVKPSWQSDELMIMGRFINRHLGKKRIWDNGFALGHRILGELIFRCANLGQASLFYSGKKFNPIIARLSFTRPFIERLIDKFWVAEGVKEQFNEEEARLRIWFGEQVPLQREFKENHHLPDWRQLIIKIWSDGQKKKLPAIVAYLLSYSGQKQPLLLLLRDYIQAFENDPDYFYPIVKLLQLAPQRQVSAVIFDALEEAVIKNPKLFNALVLADMAPYFARQIMNNNVKSPNAELDLLIYFGQNKHYKLAQIGCNELARSCKDMGLKKRLLKGALEAEVEHDLQRSLGHFYFGLIKVCKRLWYYGFNAEKKGSKIVAFCDDNSSGFERKMADDLIKTDVSSGLDSSSNLGFKVKRKQLTSLLDTIKRSTVHKLSQVNSAATRQSLFGYDQKTHQISGDKVVAEQQSVVNI